MEADIVDATALYPALLFLNQSIAVYYRAVSKHPDLQMREIGIKLHWARETLWERKIWEGEVKARRIYQKKIVQKKK